MTIKNVRSKHMAGDNRRRNKGSYAMRETELPAEWAGRVVIAGDAVSWDGAPIGLIFKSGFAIRAERPDGVKVRRFSKIAAIRYLIESQPSGEKT